MAKLHGGPTKCRACGGYFDDGVDGEGELCDGCLPTLSEQEREEISAIVTEDND